MFDKVLNEKIQGTVLKKHSKAPVIKKCILKVMDVK